MSENRKLRHCKFLLPECILNVRMVGVKEGSTFMSTKEGGSQNE